MNVAVDGRPETEYAQVVSGNYFSTLGVLPASGRTIVAADDEPGAAPVAVISHDGTGGGASTPHPTLSAAGS